MKNIKIIFALTALFYGSVASAQTTGPVGDIAINSQMIPASCGLGDTVKYEIQIANLTDNFPSAIYPPHSLLATIQAPIDGKIIGFTDEGALAGWEIFYVYNGPYANGGGTAVIIRNTVSLNGLDETYPTFKVVGVNLGSAVGNQTSESIQLNFLGGGNFGSLGDADPNNNNSGTSLEVLPQSPLPLHFLDINAAWKNEDGIVKWTVAQETENDHFRVERSFNGKDFAEVGRVKSIGNHQDKHVYLFNDVNAKTKTSDKVFYRIRQVDVDGKTSLSSVATLSTNATNAEAYIFPNPVKGNQLGFVYQNFNIKDGDMNIQILDAQGRMVMQTKEAITNGKNQMELSTSAMAAGTYYLNYQNEDNNIKGTLRFVKD